MTSADDEVERRVQEAVRARIDEVPDVDEEAALAAIGDRLRSGRSRQRFVLAGVAAAVVVIAAVAIGLARRDGTTKVATPSSESAPASSSPGSPSTPGVAKPTTPTFAGLPVWPLDSTRFGDPSSVTLSFARDYLGMSAPTAAADGDTVSVRPNGTGPTTVVETRKWFGGYIVVGAHSDQIVFDDVADGDPLPASITGRSTAFEATVVVELRPFGSSRPSEQVSVMGGANGQMGPFQAALPSPGPGVVVAYEPDASGRGALTAAAVVRVAGPPGDPSSFDGTIVGTTPTGQTVNVTSGASTPAAPARDAPSALFDVVTTTQVIESTTLFTLVSNRGFAFVDVNGRSVWDVDLFTGQAEVLFTAEHRIGSLDANVLGGLLFTDDQTGLWRWDSRSSNPSGPVKMTDGYVDASW